MHLMGVDMGTSGCKAVVFDESWQIVCQAYREYPMHIPAPGLLELDAELVWHGIQEVVREANALSPAPVRALAVSAIGDVIIPVGETGEAVRNSIVDFDPRGSEEIAEFSEKFGTERFYRFNGMPPLYIGSLAKILWIRKHEPDVCQKIRRWASYEDYIVLKMGLPPTASFSELSRTMLFDIRKKCWCREILEAADLTEDMLPRAMPSGSVIGTLPEKARVDLGFPEDVLVVTGGHDMVCAAVGAGLDEEHPEVCVDIAGTIEGLVVAMPEANTCKTMLSNLFPCYLGHAGYVTFSVNLTAGCIVRWYRDKIANDEYQNCKQNRINFYEYMQREMDPENPGSVFLLPHFSGSGNPFFNADALGTIHGLTLDTRREDIARALVEGLCYELRLHLEAYQTAGIQIRSLRAVGGGATIDKQLQLKANILGLKVTRGAVSESSALGAAAYAAVGAGFIQNPAEAYRHVQIHDKEFLPDTAAHERFERAYQTYKALCYALDGIDRNRF